MLETMKMETPVAGPAEGVAPLDNEINVDRILPLSVEELKVNYRPSWGI
jgi:hypothetical protein